MKTERASSSPVRVSLPASVAAEIGSLKKAVEGILGKLGCPACCSGHDIFWELQRDVLFDVEGLKVESNIGFNAPRLARKEGAAQMRVGLKPELADDIESVFNVIERLAEISGHPACATGCDMLFEIERMFVINREIQIDEQAVSIAGF
jgi:hypothetical protein